MQNPEHLLIFAAGNDGNFSNTCTISSPAVGKNVLAVGASSSGGTRLTVTTSSGENLVSLDQDPSDIDGVAFFSSSGPTADNRIKPEIVAPGDQVYICMYYGILSVRFAACFRFSFRQSQHQKAAEPETCGERTLCFAKEKVPMLREGAAVRLRGVLAVATPPAIRSDVLCSTPSAVGTLLPPAHAR